MTMDSYYTDHRVLVGTIERPRFDPSRMTLTVELPCDANCECGGGYCETETELPAKFEVCGTCEGRGSHVNPSIDSNGLTAEDFAEDPDSAESYVSGAYDVSCAECDGQRVVPVVDRERADPADAAAYDRALEGAWACAREAAHERAMGY